MHNAGAGLDEDALRVHAERFVRLFPDSAAGEDLPWGVGGLEGDAKRAALRRGLFRRCPCVAQSSLVEVDGPAAAEAVLQAQAACSCAGSIAELLIDESEVHWHVFDFNLLYELLTGCFSYSPLWSTYQDPFNQVFLVQKPLDL